MNPHPDYLLYHTPGSCSRVALNALEELGLPFREKPIAIMRGEHMAPDFLAINPKGKIPVLVADGITITELPVILHHLARAHPEAGLLPNGGAALSDLIWIAGALHPLAGRLFRPGSVSSGDHDSVRAMAVSELNRSGSMIEARLANSAWWYGEEWSITDMFLAWTFGLANRFGYQIAQFPALGKLIDRAEARPSFIRARAREIAISDREKMEMPPGMRL